MAKAMYSLVLYYNTYYLQDKTILLMARYYTMVFFHVYNVFY